MYTQWIMRHLLRGFGLLDLLLSLVVISTLLTLGLPSWTGLVQQQRASASLNQLLGGLAFTRTSAIMNSTTTTFCPRAPREDNPPAATQPQCGERNSWDRGALIFVDFNRNGQLDGQDTLLKQLPGWSHGAKLYWRAFRARRFLQFNPRGHTNWQNGSFVYCPANGNLRYARRVVLNTAGRAYRAYDTNGDGIDEGSQNRGLDC